MWPNGWRRGIASQTGFDGGSDDRDPRRHTAIGGWRRIAGSNRGMSEQWPTELPADSIVAFMVVHHRFNGGYSWPHAARWIDATSRIQQRIWRRNWRISHCGAPP